MTYIIKGKKKALGGLVSLPLYAPHVVLYPYKLLVCNISSAWLWQRKERVRAAMLCDLVGLVVQVEGCVSWL